MELNFTKFLFGESKLNRSVLVSVTPPSTGERTLLGVENMLQSIAVPEPFSLELAGDADGVTLMARCLDEQVVRQQISTHYPQARLREVPPGDDPMRLDEGERAWSMTLRASGPDYVPLRTFRDDDLLDPGSEPLIALLGALSDLNEGRARSLPADAPLPRPRLVAGPSRKGPQATGDRATRLHLLEPGTASPGRRDDHGRPRRRRPGRTKGLPVGAGGRDLEGRAPRGRRGRWPRRGGMGLVAHQGVAVPASTTRS